MSNHSQTDKWQKAAEHTHSHTHIHIYKKIQECMKLLIKYLCIIQSSYVYVLYVCMFLSIYSVNECLETCQEQDYI